MINKPKICAIVAMDRGRVIGVKNGLPWDLPEDRKHFASLTRGHTVLMGRKTYQSLPPQYRPLKNRVNVVVTRDPASLASEQGIVVCASPREFVQDCLSGKQKLTSEELWIVGGEQIYRETQEFWEIVELTLVDGEHQGDAWFPEFENDFQRVSETACQGYSFLTYRRI